MRYKTNRFKPFYWFTSLRCVHARIVLKIWFQRGGGEDNLSNPLHALPVKLDANAAVSIPLDSQGEKERDLIEIKRKYIFYLCEEIRGGVKSH